jgi:molybdopterin-guanine dinucleotide biosynthesis protein A
MGSGFVLAGGRSSRMGRDKALLPAGDRTLIDQIASRVRAAAGNVTLIGPPERYAALGYPVMPDRVENCGPIGGLYTALSITEADWNLVVACDMPALTTEFLCRLLRAAESSGADCVVPKTASGLEPLCAVYHRRCLAAAERAVFSKRFKMHDFISSLRFTTVVASDPSALENVNTPEQWSAR